MSDTAHINAKRPLLTTQWLTAHYLEQQMAYYRSPMYKRMVEESRARREAMPWIEKVRILVRSRCTNTRVRLGEIIAGQNFD